MQPDIVLAFGGCALAGLLAGLACWRAGRAVDRWAFVSGMIALSVESGCRGMVARSQNPGAALQWELAALTAAAMGSGIWLLFSLTYARGNAGLFLVRWRLAFFVFVGVALATVTVFRSSLVIPIPPPLGQVANGLLFQLGRAGTALQFVQLLVAVLILTNLERTFRAAVGTVRWRIKFMLLGVGLLFLIRLYASTQTVLFRHIDPNLDVLRSGTLVAACVLMLRSLVRTGHFNLDVYPSQTVLQGSVTILFVGAYLLIVGVLAKVVTYFGGDSSFTLKTLVVLLLLLLLALLLQSDRVQLQMRRLVSRHFQRPLHDYRSVWLQFTEATASRVELTEFSRAVVKLLADIFQALSVSIWIVNERRDEFLLAASTSLTESRARHLQPTAAETIAISEYLQQHTEPLGIEDREEDWAVALRRCHPDEFLKGGARICVPVVSGGEILAVILLGDRVGAAAFTLQDFDLLKSISDQVASGLLNAQLSQRLLQAREHEAFQTMATFFVHDLKNAASTLNLTLQNLPDHFDDPAFREDALRGMGKSVRHINHLISRLGELRSELKISQVPSDLNATITAAVSSFSEDKDFHLEFKPTPLPPLPLDREQFTKVVTNLVLNAREAGARQLQLSTQRTGNWAIMEAADNGCGMSAEFVARSLFRPFQTTKKNGLGIGMFQSRMIIQAHGGRMLVESTQNQGTIFRVYLPLTANTTAGLSQSRSPFPLPTK